MELDFDAILVPWDLSIKIKGVLYATRPLEVADVATITAVASDDQPDKQQMIQAVGRLFAADKPPLAELDAAYLLCLLGSIVKYWESLLAKNSKAVAALLAAAATKPSPSGSSSPLS